jgi:hypothetical protein
LLGGAVAWCAASFASPEVAAQVVPDPHRINTNVNKFRQLGTELPTPNVYRTASGAPGHAYWQQQADYNMKIRLDDDRQRIDGQSQITYTNNSPDALSYVWLQLDQNLRALDSDAQKIATTRIEDRMTFDAARKLEPWFDGGFKITQVADAAGKSLPYVINYSMMRVDLPTPIPPGGKLVLNLGWWYNINDRIKLGGRVLRGRQKLSVHHRPILSEDGRVL